MHVFIGKSFILIFIILGSFLFLSNNVLAQIEDDAYSRSSLFLGVTRSEFTSLTVNYDYRITRFLSITAGMRVPSSLFIYSFFSEAQLHANYLAGFNSHFLELGGGLTLLGGFHFLVPSSTIGYRYQPSEGGLLFRFGLVPYYYPSEVGFIEPRVSFSLGYAFKPKNR